MKKSKLFKLMAVLSPVFVLSIFSVNIYAQEKKVDRSPAIVQFEPELKNSLTEKEQKKLQELRTVKVDNTYAARPDYSKIAQHSSKKVLLSDDDLKAIGLKTTKTEVKRDVAAEDIDPEEIKRAQALMAQQLLNGSVTEEKKEVDVKVEQKEKVKEQENLVTLTDQQKQDMENDIEAESIRKQVKAAKDDSEGLLAETDESLLKDGIDILETEAEELTTKVKDSDLADSDLEKLQKELEETKANLAEAQRRLKETEADKELVLIRNKSMEKAYCEQRSQISKLTEKVDDFAKNIYAPLAQNNQMMMQLMMMQQFSNPAMFNPGYSSMFNPANSFGQDYGMKMFGLTSLFDAQSMGGMNYNVYNVGGNFYGADYAHNANTTHPMQQMMNPMQQQIMDPMQKQMVNTSYTNQPYGMHSPYSYNMNGIMDSTNRSSFNFMNSQNM